MGGGQGALRGSASLPGSPAGRPCVLGHRTHGSLYLGVGAVTIPKPCHSRIPPVVSLGSFVMCRVPRILMLWVTGPADYSPVCWGHGSLSRIPNFALVVSEVPFPLPIQARHLSDHLCVCEFSISSAWGGRNPQITPPGGDAAATLTWGRGSRRDSLGFSSCEFLADLRSPTSGAFWEPFVSVLCVHS